MSGLTIYMEGGGTGPNTKALLRQGMTTFLREIKDAVREKSWHWKLVCCGGRDKAFKAFRHARSNSADTTVVLLVDAEGPVQTSAIEHLATRDRWDLNGVDSDMVHLMTQTMETWIVADPNTLTKYYGQDFSPNVLPKALNLESVGKGDIARALERATQNTKKGKYKKICHASDLLKLVHPARVRERCSFGDRLFTVLTRVTDGG